MKPIEDSKPEFLTKEHLLYLDKLRESGATNMLGATLLLLRQFPDLSEQQAKQVLVYWMEHGKNSEDVLTISEETMSNEIREFVRQSNFKETNKMDAWESKREVSIYGKDGEQVIDAELVKVIDDNYAIYKTGEPTTYGVVWRYLYQGKLFENVRADYNTPEEAERWIIRICEVCGEQKLIRIMIDQGTLWGDEEEYYPPGAEGWYELDFDFCGNCGHVQGGKVHLS